MEEELFSIDLNTLKNDVSELSEEEAKDNSEKQNESPNPTNKTEPSKEDDSIDVSVLKDISKENKEEDKIKGIKTNEDPQDSKEFPSSPIFTSLASALKDEGIFSSINEDKLKDIKTADDFKEAFEEELKSARYLGLNQLQREALDAMDHGVPIEMFVKSKTNEQYYNSINEEDVENDENLKRQVIEAEFIQKGFSQEEAEESVDDIFDLGKEDDKAKKALQSLKRIESQRIEQIKEANKQKLIEDQERNKKEIEDLKNKVISSEEFIPGFPVSNTMKEKVFESMTKIVAQDNYGNPLNSMQVERSKDPYTFETKLHYLWNLSNGFKDFSKLVKKSKTTALKNLEEQLSSTKSLEGGLTGLTATGKNLMKAIDNIEINKL